MNTPQILHVLKTWAADHRYVWDGEFFVKNYAQDSEQILQT